MIRTVISIFLILAVCGCSAPWQKESSDNKRSDAVIFNEKEAFFYDISWSEAEEIVQARKTELLDFSLQPSSGRAMILRIDNDLETSLTELAREIAIIVYADENGRSQVAASRLVKAGFLHVYRLPADKKKWEEFSREGV